MATETKERILDVAERLFAEGGFPATSLRDITAEAGVNLASVNYHFGSKEALLASVLERRFRPINERRLQLLGEIEARAGDQPPDAEDVLRAFLAPPFQKQQEWGASGHTFLRLVGRIHAETNEEHRATFLQQFDEVVRRFTTALGSALPHLDRSDLRWRMLFVVGSMAFAMGGGRAMVTRDPESARDPDDIIESLIQFAAAGMSAPVPLAVPVVARTKGHTT